MGEVILFLAAALIPHYRLSLVCPPSEPGQRLIERARGLGVSTLPLEARYRTPALDDLHGWVCKQHIDLFHCHAGAGWECFGGVEVAREAHVPVVVRTEHLPYILTHPVQQADYERTRREVDRIICVGQGVFDSYLQAGVPARQLCVVRNGIPLRRERVDREGVRAGLNLPGDARLVLTVGRLTEQKGHARLLDAAPAVLAAVPNAHFLWVGEGPLEGELRERVESEGLGGQVHFLSRRNDVAQLAAASDVFVLPSLFEGLPLSLLEGMAAGLPAVGTRVCGITEVIREGETGRLVPPGDGGALSKAIVGVLQQPDLAARWGEAGRLRVAREFSVEHMAQNTRALYDSLLMPTRASAQEIESAQPTL